MHAVRSAVWLLIVPALAHLASTPFGCSDSGGGGGGGGSAAAAAQGGAGGAQLPLLAGAAAVDITPAPGAPLAGFGASPRRKFTALNIPLHLLALSGNCIDLDPTDAVSLFEPAQGTLDPIMARAVVISNGVTKIAIVKLDMIATTRQIHDDLARVASGLGIPAENLIVCATHTHSGPGAMTTRRIWWVIAADCYNDGLYRQVRAGCEQALVQADAALRPARVGYGKTFETAASRNRAGRPGVFDPEIGILKVVEAQGGAPIAAVLNFAVHGTKHGSGNMLFSADVMGEAERVVEGRLGGGVALFVNGAEGDVSPSSGCGPIVGNRYADAWPAVQVQDWVELGGAFEDVPLPPVQFNTGCFPIPGTSNTICDFLPGFTTAIPVDNSWLAEWAPFKAVRIGRAVLATVPGEALTEVGWEIKARGAAKGFDQTFVIGLANEHISYIATRAEYLRGEYEGMATLFGPDTDRMVIDASERVMERVRP